MNTFSLPGFTAEASLSPTASQYSTPSLRRRGSVGRGVVAQLSTIGLGDTGGGGGDEPDCILRCYWRCGRYGCFPSNCYWLCF